MNSLAGLPLVMSEHVSENEIYLVVKGKKRTVVVHEGPMAGQTIEEWIKKPLSVRIINLGDNK